MLARSRISRFADLIVWEFQRLGVMERHLTWKVSGPETTIDHFAVLAQAGHEWTEAADVPPGSHSVKLTKFQPGEEPTAFLCGSGLQSLRGGTKWESYRE
jgi:hypothetical protein